MMTHSSSVPSGEQTADWSMLCQKATTPVMLLDQIIVFIKMFYKITEDTKSRSTVYKEQIVKSNTPPSSHPLFPNSI